MSDDVQPVFPTDPTPLTDMTDHTADIRSLISAAQAAARAEATRKDGSVDALAEALAFRRLVVEAATQAGED